MTKPIHFSQELIIPTHEQLHRVLPMCYLIFIVVKCYVKVCNSVTCFIAAKHTRVVDRVGSCYIYDLKVHFERATSFATFNFYPYFTGRYNPIMPEVNNLFDQLWNVNQRSSSKLLTTRRERKGKESHLSFQVDECHRLLGMPLLGLVEMALFSNAAASLSSPAVPWSRPQSSKDTLWLMLLPAPQHTWCRPTYDMAVQGAATECTDNPLH
ncbi:hypothetical protein EMCRGX_G025525 [Ephydatia muelleri]